MVRWKIIFRRGVQYVCELIQLELFFNLQEETKLKKILVAGIVVCFVMTMFTSAVFAGNDSITCYSFRGDSGTQSFAVYQHSTSEVMFQPWKTGTWRFEAYHFNSLMCNQYVNVFAYWRDASNPNDSWHYFNSGTACFNVFQYKFDCYSGKSAISYKFVLVNYSDYPMTTKIKLTKLN